jgi:hypothetical protein
MKLIEWFTQPLAVNWMHMVEPRYLAIVGGNMPIAIMESEQHCFKLGQEQAEIIVCLPCPMVWQAIVIRLFPSQFANCVVKVGVSGGMT